MNNRLYANRSCASQLQFAARRIRYLLLALLPMLLLACGGPQRYPAIPAGATVLVLGDSISYGTGAGRGEDYPTLLAAMTGWTIVNAGVPKDTTADGLKRLPGLLDAHSPKLVLVELGGNDLLQQMPPTQVADNLKAILAAIRARGIPAVVLAVPRPSALGMALQRLGDAPLYASLGDDVPTIPKVFAEVLSNETLKADPIHPNAAGYRQVAERLRDALREMGFLH
jgi:acyl-CoA thioesterase I